MVEVWFAIGLALGGPSDWFAADGVIHGTNKTFPDYESCAKAVAAQELMHVSGHGPYAIACVKGWRFDIPEAK